MDRKERRMKEWICREMSTSTGNSENGVLMRETELIRCKDCKYWCTDDGMFKDIDERQWHHCSHIGIDTEEYFFCSEAERKEE